MKALDRVLQRWRMMIVRSYVFSGARVLDVGCADGTLFKYLGSKVGEAVGVDPGLNQSVTTHRCRLIAGRFPDDIPTDQRFDTITMLAVLEHIPPDEQRRWASACASLLKNGGHLVITVPSPIVDSILALLKSARLIDGMSLEQHYGFDPNSVPLLFSGSEMELIERQSFQLGCNNLFVFRKVVSAPLIVRDGAQTATLGT